MEGDLGKVMVLKTKFNDQTPSRNIGIATICQDLNILESQCLNLEKVQNMLRFVDPNSVKIMDNKKKTYALHEAAERGYVKIMMVMKRSPDCPFHMMCRC